MQPNYQTVTWPHLVRPGKSSGEWRGGTHQTFASSFSRPHCREDARACPRDVEGWSCGGDAIVRSEGKNGELCICTEVAHPNNRNTQMNSCILIKHILNTGHHRSLPAKAAGRQDEEHRLNMFEPKLGDEGGWGSILGASKGPIFLK